MKRWMIAGAVLLAIAVATGGWWVLQPGTTSEAPSTTIVRRASIERSVLATGTIEASSLVTVGAEVSGRIESLHVELGDEVAEGDLIAQIDSLNQENAVRSAEAALANIKAQRTIQEAALAQAQASLERAEKLHAEQITSDADYQAAQLAVQTGEGQLAVLDAQITQAEINVESAQLSLERTRIVAPTNGTIVAIAVEVGQSVNASNTTPTIVKIANLDQMLVKAEISEADVPLVESGQRVYLTILGEPDNRITATLQAIEPAPSSILTESSTTSTAIYYNGLFEVPNPDHKLRISMTAQVTIILESAEDVLTVPASVLDRQTPDGDYVVRVLDEATGLAEPRVIKVGLNDKITAEVLSGLDEGDQVVVADGGTAAAEPAGGNAQGQRGGGLLGGAPTGGRPPV